MGYNRNIYVYWAVQNMIEHLKGIDSMVDAIKDLNYKLKSLNDRTVKRCPAV